jgi:hypothetical protein
LKILAPIVEGERSTTECVSVKMAAPALSMTGVELIIITVVDLQLVVGEE